MWKRYIYQFHSNGKLSQHYINVQASGNEFYKYYEIEVELYSVFKSYSQGGINAVGLCSVVNHVQRNLRS